jgi:hypothetical protein
VQQQQQQQQQQQLLNCLTGMGDINNLKHANVALKRRHFRLEQLVRRETADRPNARRQTATKRRLAAPCALVNALDGDDESRTGKSRMSFYGTSAQKKHKANASRAFITHYFGDVD